MSVFNASVFDPLVFLTDTVSPRAGMFGVSGRKKRKREVPFEEFKETVEEYIAEQAPIIVAAIEENNDRQMKLKRANRAAFMLLH